MCDCKGKCATVRCLCRKLRQFCSRNCACNGRCQNIMFQQASNQNNMNTNLQAERAMQLALHQLQQFPQTMNKLTPMHVNHVVTGLNSGQRTSMTNSQQMTFAGPQQFKQTVFLACPICATPVVNGPSLSLPCGHNIHLACLPSSNKIPPECPVCALYSMNTIQGHSSQKEISDPAFDTPTCMPAVFRPVSSTPAVDATTLRLAMIVQKDLSLWTEAELVAWMQHFHNGHYRSIQLVFRHVSGFDVANIMDDDYRAHIHHMFQDEPSRAIVALSCWRQLRTYMHSAAPVEPAPKPSRRRKRPTLNFGTMLRILQQWQTNIDSGQSESSAARMLQDERVCRTTLRSWRHISKLALDHNIDLNSAPHAARSVSLSYVHKLIAKPNRVVTVESRKHPVKSNSSPTFLPSSPSSTSASAAPPP